MIPMDNRLNYYALTVALEKSCLPEQAFDMLENVRLGERFRLNNEVDIAVLQGMRQRGLTLKEIGEYYGYSQTRIFKVLERAGRG